MQFYVVIALVFLSTSFANAQDPADKVKLQEDLNSAIADKIPTISDKDILSKYRNSITPVKIKEPSSDDNVIIKYDIPKKNLPKSLNEVGSFANFDLKIQPLDSTTDISTLIHTAYRASTVGQSEAALTIYKEALKKDDHNQNVLFALASIYHRLQQFTEAKLYYKKLLTINPDYSKALNNYLLLLSEENPMDSLTELKKMEADNPDYSPIIAQIGMIYAHIGEFDLAEKNLKKALMLSPEVVNYRYNLAVIYDQMKRYKEAAILYQQLLDMDSAGQSLPQSKEAIRDRLNSIKAKVAID
ncbi:MAG: tetratricopeptide repeat protein [Rickettsiales bacterium]